MLASGDMTNPRSWVEAFEYLKEVPDLVEESEEFKMVEMQVRSCIDNDAATQFLAFLFKGLDEIIEPETILESLKREVREETGLVVEIEGLLDVFHGKEHPNGASIIILYTGSVVSGMMEAGDDVDGVDFFDPANLPPIAFETTQKALKHIQTN